MVGCILSFPALFLSLADLNLVFISSLLSLPSSILILLQAVSPECMVLMWNRALVDPFWELSKCLLTALAPLVLLTVAFHLLLLEEVIPPLPASTLVLKIIIKLAQLYFLGNIIGYLGVFLFWGSSDAILLFSFSS